MKTSKKYSAGLAAALMLLGASVASAANITINDNNTGNAGTPENDGTANGGWYKGGSAYMATSGATDALSEYQEVEPLMQIATGWDLAAFVTPNNGRLGIVSAYDLANGFGGTTIGDIMISINPAGLVSYPDNGTPYSQFTTNADFGFDYAVQFDFTAGTYRVLELTSTTVMENGDYYGNPNGYNAASQPWRVSAGFNGNIVTTGSLYYSNTASVAAMSAQTGYTVTSDYKYYAEISTSWLDPFLNTTNPVALYKLTMECGNDNLVGVQTSGFNQVPDGSATLALLGLGFLGLVGVSKFKNRKVA